MSTLTLSQIWIYPVKSLGGIQLQTAEFSGKGLLFDRRWMLIDVDGVFLTQRAHPEMSLFKVSLTGDRMTIIFKNGEGPHPSTNFGVGQVSQAAITAQIWSDEVTVNEVHPGISAWFSAHLGISCRLVCFPEENPRPLDAGDRLNNEHVSLADAYPFLLIGQASLDDLNKRLDDPVPMNRFRPNFVVSGALPYEEDSWNNLSIGENKFVAVKKCARCTVPGINQDTGEKGQEPVRTLARYRTVGNKIYFGEHLVGLGHGIVTVGDRVSPGK
jgi:uncharacterized protein YcbX